MNSRAVLLASIRARGQTAPLVESAKPQESDEHIESEEPRTLKKSDKETPRAPAGLAIKDAFRNGSVQLKPKGSRVVSENQKNEKVVSGADGRAVCPIQVNELHEQIKARALKRSALASQSRKASAAKESTGGMLSYRSGAAPTILVAPSKMRPSTVGATSLDEDLRRALNKRQARLAAKSCNDRVVTAPREKTEEAVNDKETSAFVKNTLSQTSSEEPGTDSTVEPPKSGTEKESLDDRLKVSQERKEKGQEDESQGNISADVDKTSKSIIYTAKKDLKKPISSKIKSEKSNSEEMNVIVHRQDVKCSDKVVSLTSSRTTESVTALASPTQSFNLTSVEYQDDVISPPKSMSLKNRAGRREPSKSASRTLMEAKAFSLTNGKYDIVTDKNEIQKLWRRLSCNLRED